MVLDESTSNLDSQTEHLIYETLERLIRNRTTLVIAHRMATNMRADRVGVLREGQIVQEGTHHDLIREHEGLYYQLCRQSLLPSCASLCGISDGIR